MWKKSVSSIKLFAPKPAQDSTQAPVPKQFLHPARHPIKMNEKMNDIITYRIPNRPMTELFTVPLEARFVFFPYFESPPDAKSIEVAVIGPPNSGKSTLINSMLTEAVLPSSRKANTTQGKLLGIRTIDDTQIVFHDTPGIISTHGAKTNRIATVGWESISDSDIALFVVDGVKNLWDDTRAAASRLQKLLQERADAFIEEARILGETDAQFLGRQKDVKPKVPAILVVNKVDLAFDRSKVRSLANELSEFCNFSDVFYISATKKYNTEKLLEHLKSQAEENEWQHHPAKITNLSDMEKAENIIRNELFEYFHDELPYTWIVRTVSWTPYLDGTLRIDIDILVEHEKQKGILIGREAKCIKIIHNHAQNNLVKLYKRPIQLFIRARLMKDWVKGAIRRNETLQTTIHPRFNEAIDVPERIKKLITVTPNPKE